jgi:hypothetical protein
VPVLLAHLSQLGVPQNSDFEILKFLKKLRSQKIMKLVLKTFMLDGSNFDKRCLLRISI